MPMDGWTLGFALREAEKEIVGGRVDKITQPEKDALVLQLRCGGQNKKLLLSASPVNARLQLTNASFVNPAEPPVFCMLLRKKLSGARIAAMEQVKGDRILRIVFDSLDEMNEPVQLTLILEVMSHHSNLTLVDNRGRIVDAIRRVSAEKNRVRELLPGAAYLPPPSQDKLDPLAFTPDELYGRLSQSAGRFDKALSSSLMGFSPAIAREAAMRLSGSQNALLEEINLQAVCAQAPVLLRELTEASSPVLLRNADGGLQDLFPFPYFSVSETLQTPAPSLWDAMDAFFNEKDIHERMGQRAASMTHTVKTHLERCQRKLALQEEAIDNARHMDEYRVCAELLTANLHLVRKGDERALVPNYYDPDMKPMEISLDVTLSPAQNAQRYYKKYQKARSAAQEAVVQKENTQRELLILSGALDDLTKSTTEAELEEIRHVLEDAGFLKKPGKKGPVRHLPASVPYRYMSSDGIEIHVGKNSTQNERLTGSARGNEMWLHVKDRPGSHVIIRTEDEVPQATLLEAARLALWYSSVKNSANVPVDYTLRRYVKKPGGTPMGFVTYKNQHTLYMTVTESEIRTMKQL